MTRKDYVAFANELGDVLANLTEYYSDIDVGGIEQSSEIIAFWDTVNALSRVLRNDNGRFRSEQFKEAIEHRATTGKLVRIGQTNFGKDG